MNKKEEAKLTHQLACVTYLTRDILEDFTKNKTLTQEAKEVLEACAILQKHSETMLEEVFGIKSISNGTYLNELSNKVDTVIRKNFENIK